MALILMLAISALLVVFPLVSAHDPPQTIKTYGFIEVQPDPVGVGQTAYVAAWVDKVPPTASGSWGVRWHNMKLSVTKPDGETEVIGIYDSDSTGGAWTSYVPNEVGEYTFNFEWPGQVFDEDENPYPYFSYMVLAGKAFLNDTYTGCSASTTLTVQEEPIESAYDPNPLPTEYWSRPIHSMNREWYSLGGNWLGLGATTFGTTGMYSHTGNFNPYTTAPNSAHVIWTEPLHFGGQIGGEFGSGDTQLYATGTAYEAKFNAVIMYGILYYTEYPGAGNNPTGLKAVDLRTGETVWEKPIITPLKCGMIYNFQTGSQYGAHAYLFTAPASVGFVPYPPGNSWEMYDAMTGEWILDIANASAGLLVRGENGELLSYTASGGMLTLWNSSKCIAAGAEKNLSYRVYSSTEVWRPPQGATIDWNDGYEWSVPIATEISGNPISMSIRFVSDDVVLVTQSAPSAPGGSTEGWRIDAGYSAIDGSYLWGPVNRTLLEWGSVMVRYAAGEGVYGEYTRQTFTWIGYSLETGEKLWGPTEPYNSSWAYHDYTAPGIIGYGNLYTWGLSGEVYCYDVQTGELKWSWYAGNAGIDTPYGSWPLGTFGTHHVLADGKLYVRAGHDYTPPVFKGAKLYCLNATTGEEIWSSLSFDINGSPACADGYMVWFNGYDDQVYCYGKGPSATTVSIQDDVLRQGDSVLVKGTVTDESPGTKEYAQSVRFPHGVPAISDEDQSAWMEYLYQQQPKPEDVTGVEVFIKIQDPNGDYYSATVTADENGVFSLMWAPSIVGEYHVTAMFEGSESYYASQATTAFGVDSAPEYPESPTVEEIAAESASRTIAMMPQYPDVPTAEEIASDAASRTIAMLPQYPTPYPTAEIPAYQTVDLVIIVLVVVAILIGLYGIIRKQK